MKTLPATNPQAATLCLSPVAVWQMLLARLLDQHYGLTLNDTPFSDETVIPVYLWPMPLIFWWKSTGWFVLIAGDSTG